MPLEHAGVTLVAALEVGFCTPYKTQVFLFIFSLGGYSWTVDVTALQNRLAQLLLSLQEQVGPRMHLPLGS